MILTQRQLELLHNGNGHIVLPYRARLTPLAQDWVRQKKIAIGYADVETKPPISTTPRDEPPAPSRAVVWWCDGPCGPAKAALMAQAKESSLNELGVANDANQLVPAIKRIADDIKGEVPLGLVVLRAGVGRPHDEIIQELVGMVRNRIGPLASFKVAAV